MYPISLSGHRIPVELLHNIALALIAHQPLGPPTDLLPLFLTSKHIYLTLSSDSFLAKICRLKLDVTAIERRAFKPVDEQLASHLKKSFRMIKLLRRKLTARTFLPHYLPSEVPIPNDDDDLTDGDLLPELYLLRLDSDGKNYAQLEHAGIRDYVRDFVLNRLYEGAERNDGWPLENAQNSCALWLMWMFTLKDDLQNETPAERETIVRNILPYGTLTHRYPASEAPPNHFHLPLLPHLRSHQFPLVHQLPTSTSDPSLSPPALKSRLVYPHYLSPSRASTFHLFDAELSLSAPLASIAAKLLFVARRELFLIRAPPHVPQAPPAAIPGAPQPPFAQPTVADYDRLNQVKAARVPMWAKWDWDRGCAGRVNQVPVTPTVVVPPPPSSSSTTIPTATTPTTTNSFPVVSLDDDNFEESKLWDTTWHRHRMCIDYTEPKPVFEPGKVYVPGTMDAQWEGKIWLPALQAFNQALQPQNAAFPGPPPLYNMPGMPPPPFSERTLMMTMQFSFLDVKEHWRVCGCVERGERCEVGCKHEGGGVAPDVQMRTGEEERVWTRVQKRGRVMGGVEEDEEEDEDEDVDMEYEDEEDEEDEEEDEDEDDSMSSCESDYAMSDACSPPSEPATRASESQHRKPSLRLDEHAACGIIPVPLPVMVVPPPSSSRPSSPPTPIDPAAAPIVPAHVAAQLPPTNVQTLVPGQDGMSVTDPQTGIVVPLPPGTNINKVDFSMSNAWFPGRLGGVGIVRRDGLACAPSFSVPSSSSSSSTTSTTTSPSSSSASSLSVIEEDSRPRDEVVVFVNYDIPTPEGVRGVDGSCVSLGVHPGTVNGNGKGRERKEHMWVYETYDKKRAGTHGRHGLRGGEVELVEGYVREERMRDERGREMQQQQQQGGGAGGAGGNAGRSWRMRTDAEVYDAAVKRAFEGGVICCLKCLEVARVKRDEKKKMDQRARKALDGFLRDFGRGKGGVEEDDDDDDEVEEEEERGGEMVLDDLDIPSFGFDFGGDNDSNSSSSSSNTYTTLRNPTTTTTTTNTTNITTNTTSTPFATPPSRTTTNTLHPPHPSAPLIFGDDSYHGNGEKYDNDEDENRYNHAAHPLALRPSYDRSKVGVECDGVRDVILTGETTVDRRCWGRVGVYGRVRPWDGLVGILRVSQNNEERDTYMFIFGYVVGGENFVGEWRLAMTDPTAPAWSGAFVMSRKERA